MKMYLDDIRTPKYKFDVIVRSFYEATSYVEENGIPEYISFDHDLGCDKEGIELESGFDFVKWLVDMDIENKYNFPNDFDFNVHSANPIGKENIESLLNSYLNFKNKKIKVYNKY
ncbi:hypothetical protein LPB137_05215 [Poseidonibacter parvus]|uniref:Cyclic-phosphate processing Receiver domain-containing protein n=1 Tax=Poseidonibacter parvus TaxID=1850254 RepID=A0A1P8KL68_9BACT|nr:cyclic-phosphate processing receiver domain-containing protein [Poseidonibacter parvus]APW65289.1 hypothetical protein LPB137_05215 [Poseidonibacter parvus]